MNNQSIVDIATRKLSKREIIMLGQTDDGLRMVMDRFVNVIYGARVGK